MIIYIRTYNYSGSYLLPKPGKEMGSSETTGLEMKNPVFNGLSQLIKLNTEADVIRYLIFIHSEWKGYIEENLNKGTLAENIEAIGNLYEQIMQLTWLLLKARILRDSDYNYFAKSINQELDLIHKRTEYDLEHSVHQLNHIPMNGYGFNFSKISYIDEISMLSIILI